ncbi:MAG: aminotransferase class I/II-fold pyridoxal phosphate-dependent enzyme, partial [Halobacteriota archaeon]
GRPGVRPGCAGPDGTVGERLRTARPAWSLGGPAAAVGAHAMADSGFVDETRRRVDRERAFLREGLGTRGFDVFPSDAPFVLCDVGESPDELLAACRERGVVLRDATTFRGLDSHVRIAVRTRGVTDRLLSVLDEVR